MDQDFHLIEKYFRGELSEEELQVFNDKLQHDSKFEQEFRDMKFIREGAKESARANALSILQNAEANLTEKETTKINVSMRRLVSIAASLIIIATVSYFAISNRTGGTMTGDEVFTAYYEAYPNIVSGQVRGENIEINTLSARAYNAYDIEDFSKSADLFAELLSAEKSAENYFYSGIANLETGNLDVAKANFNRIIRDFKSFNSQAKWYLSLALIKDNAIEEASSLTAHLALGESDYSKKAKSMLGRLGLMLDDEDLHSGTSEGSNMIPPGGSSPDGTEFEVIRQYQVGVVKSMKDGKRYRFYNEEPIRDLEDGDFVEFVVLKSKRGKEAMAIVLTNYK